MARSCILQIAVKWGCAFVGVNSYQRLRTQAKRSPGKQQSRDLILFSFYLHALTVLETENANIYMRGKVKAVPSFLDQHIRSEGVCPTVFAVGLDPPRYWAKQRRDWRAQSFQKWDSWVLLLLPLMSAAEVALFWGLDTRLWQHHALQIAWKSRAGLQKSLWGEDDENGVAGSKTWAKSPFGCGQFIC